MHTFYWPQIQQWLTNTRELPPFKELDSALVNHMATCAICRGALVLLFTELCHMPPDTEYVTCEACQHDLAAYIEIERNEGVVAAMQELPAVWWHLWVCPTCAETYRVTNALLDAEARGELALFVRKPSVSSPVPIPLLRLHVPRVLVYRFSRMSARLGAAWGNDTHGVIIQERAFDGYHMSVSVQLQADATWHVAVQVTPPVIGHARLISAGSVWRAPFNLAGEAVIDTLPAAFFMDSDGPDLVIEVDHDSI